MPPKNKSNEIKITRIYDATVDIVWAAWTDPVQAAKWWGPRGFTLTTHSKDLRVGGHWHYTMHGPDGTDYPNKTIYHEVDKHKRLVYDHGGYDDRPPLFRVTVLFKQVGKKTQMDMTMAFPTPEVAEQSKKFIKQAGGNATWDRLAEYLENEDTGKDIFVINRSFETSMENLFDMWVDPKHFSHWMGPSGTGMEYLNVDIAVGKTTFYKMTYDSGVTMYGKMTFLKIERPTHLEYIQFFCDEKGNLSKHPMVPVWPEHMRTSVLFTSEGENQTRLTLIWEPHGDCSEAELQVFREMRAGMTQGWTQSFDKLENYLI